MKTRIHYFIKQKTTNYDDTMIFFHIKKKKEKQRKTKNE